MHHAAESDSLAVKGGGTDGYQLQRAQTPGARRSNFSYLPYPWMKSSFAIPSRFLRFPRVTSWMDTTLRSEKDRIDFGRQLSRPLGGQIRRLRKPPFARSMSQW